jgi:hypothetical protein
MAVLKGVPVVQYILNIPKRLFNGLFNGKVNPFVFSFFHHSSVTWQELEKMDKEKLEEGLPKIFKEVVLSILLCLGMIFLILFGIMKLYYIEEGI